MPIPAYPKEVRERATALYTEHPEWSYSAIADKLYEEFPDVFSKPPNKTTIRAWVLKKKKKELTQPQPEINNTNKVKEENPTKEVEKTEDVKKDGIPSDVPRITPEEIAVKLAKESTVVPTDDTSENIDDIVNGEETVEEEEPGKIKKLLSNKILIIAGVAAIIAVVIFVLIKHRKASNEEKPTAKVTTLPDNTERVENRPGTNYVEL